MKISKTSWLLLAVGISIITLAGLGVTRARQLHEQDRVNEELSLVRQRLNGFQLEELRFQQEELEKQISQTISQLEADKTTLSRPIGSIVASDILFDIAETCGVEVTEISSSGLITDDLEGIACSVLTLTAHIEGDVPNLVDFITKVNGDFMTGTVKSVDMNVSENTTEERPSANIRLHIYTYQGD